MNSQFQLPSGYTCWCHICGEEPFNKVTDVNGVKIKGLGFKTLKELQEHERDIHRVWKG